MTKYDSIEADPEAIAHTAKDEGDDIKVSCRANKFAVKMLTIVAVIAVLGVVAVRGMTTSNTPKIANVDFYQGGLDSCNTQSDCPADRKCCYGVGVRWMSCYELDATDTDYCPWHYHY